MIANTVVANQVPRAFPTSEIGPGYAEWMLDVERTQSKKVELGTWWRLDVTYWRVSWIEATGELFAAERKPSDRYVVLAQLEKKQVSDLMHNWYDGDNLRALFQRFGHEVA